MSDMDWYGDAPDENLGGQDGGGADGTSLGGGVPVPGYPGLYAGDFANGQGALGIRREPVAPAAGDPGARSNPVNIDDWVRHLGDQGIASQMVDGKLSVFQQLQPIGSDGQMGYGAVGINDYVPGQTEGQPAGWNKKFPRQTSSSDDWSHPVYQDLDAYQRATNYLSQSPIGAQTLDNFSRARVPVVMIEDTKDRFGNAVNNPTSPILYWDPTSALLTTDRTVDAQGHFPNPADELSERSSLMGLQSPALGLLHEMGHALMFRNDPQTYTDGLKNGVLSNGWGNTEEQANIQFLETPAAEQLGEPTRTNHSAFDLWRVTDPTLHWPGRDFN